MKILFIEDEQVFNDAYHYIVKIWREKGLTISKILPPIHDLQSAKDEINKWKENPDCIPNLIFLDIILPKTKEDYLSIQNETPSLDDKRLEQLAGIEVFEEISNFCKDKQKNISIIILTANYRLPLEARKVLLERESLKVYWADKPFIPEDVAEMLFPSLKADGKFFNHS